MKRVFLYSVTVGALLVGCGGGGSSTHTSLKEIKDIDANIVHAKVCDGKGICGITDENGIARANFDLNTTLTSIGGFIDANGNGIKDLNELNAPLLLAPAGAGIITPLTSLVAKGADINKLAEILGVTPKEILSEDPFETNNVKLIKAFNAVYPVIKENKTDELVKEINLYNPNLGGTDLPDFGSSVNVNIYSLAKTVVTDPNDKAYIDTVENTDFANAEYLSEILEEKKQNIIKIPAPVNTGLNSETNITDTLNNNHTDESNISSVTNTTSNSGSVVTASSGKTDLPDFSSDNTLKSTPVKPVNSDLPQFNNDNVKLIPTDNTYNPTYTPLPKRYFVKLNEFNDFIELKKDNDKKYHFLNEKYFNVATKDFNDTALFDINASYVFNNLNFTPDGNLNGTVFITLKDLNDSSEVNFSVKNVKFVVNNQKVIKTDLSGVSVDVNSTAGNSQKSFNAGTYDKFDINLSKVMVDYNESEFNQTNHDYSFNIDYNVSGNILNLSGKYGVIKAVAPSVSLKETSYLVAKNSDINLSVGTSNVANANCSVDLSPLHCYVDNAKNIYLYGKTPDKEEIDVVTLTINNQGYKDSKSFYLEVLKPADNQIVKSWNLSDANYSGYHIEMNLTGSMTNNIVDVNTSALPNIGTPDNNVTVYLFNSSSDNSNYIRFTFDANVYKSNDWFIIKRADKKEVRFRVGDVSISNNTFSFK